MLNSINQKNNSTNFKAIIPVKIHSGGQILTDSKQIESVLDNLTNILLKTDKLELKNGNKNEAIRQTFKSKINDYFIPTKPFEQLNQVGGLGQKIRKIKNFATGNHFLLTRKEADTLDSASIKIKYANALKDKNQRNNAREAAKSNYGKTVQNLLQQITYDSPQLTINVNKGEYGKITINDIYF